MGEGGGTSGWKGYRRRAPSRQLEVGRQNLDRGSGGVEGSGGLAVGGCGCGCGCGCAAVDFARLGSTTVPYLLGTARRAASTEVRSRQSLENTGAATRESAPRRLAATGARGAWPRSLSRPTQPQQPIMSCAGIPAVDFSSFLPSALRLCLSVYAQPHLFTHPTLEAPSTTLPPPTEPFPSQPTRWRTPRSSAPLCMPLTYGSRSTDKLRRELLTKSRNELTYAPTSRPSPRRGKLRRSSSHTSPPVAAGGRDNPSAERRRARG